MKRDDIRLTPSLPYSVEAYNLSRESENKIHDDAVARNLGFTGGLVPGVEVYAYLCHPVVARWGRAWLERGSATCRFLKPVYDGRMAEVTAQNEEAGLALSLSSEGSLCATATAGLGAPPPTPDIASYETREPPLERPTASQASLAEGTWLGTIRLDITSDVAATYLDAVRETDPLYANEKLVHPGLILRQCNATLIKNVILGPWIHMGSTVQNFAAAHVGDQVSVRAKVVRNYERKGHRWVDLDALVIVNETTPVAHVLHTAIYEPRGLAAASRQMP